MTTETVLVNGEPVVVKRLDEGGRYHAINNFVWAIRGTECSDDEFDAVAIGCRVLYRDDYDAGRSWYQVVDANGHGDGSGEWTEVVS